MPEDTPVLDTVASITAASLENGTLGAREHMIARLAALIAVDAPGASYLVNIPTAAEMGLTMEDVQGVLVAVAPIVGTPRIVSASSSIADAFDFVIDVVEGELEDED